MFLYIVSVSSEFLIELAINGIEEHTLGSGRPSVMVCDNKFCHTKWV